VRRVLYMAVVAGLRSNAELRKVYDRLIKELPLNRATLNQMLPSRTGLVV
jgi:hypothetical protein